MKKFENLPALFKALEYSIRTGGLNPEKKILVLFNTKKQSTIKLHAPVKSFLDMGVRERLMIKLTRQEKMPNGPVFLNN